MERISFLGGIRELARPCRRDMAAAMPLEVDKWENGGHVRPGVQNVYHLTHLAGCVDPLGFEGPLPLSAVAL